MKTVGEKKTEQTFGFIYMIKQTDNVRIMPRKKHKKKENGVE
jgi:hypothetical protein